MTNIKLYFNKKFLNSFQKHLVVKEKLNRYTFNLLYLIKKMYGYGFNLLFIDKKSNCE